MRTARAFLVVGLLAAACHSSSGGSTPGDDAAGGDGGTWTGNDAGTPGVVSCYSEGAPTATCTLPSHCCFSNFTAAHNGACSSSTCSWGTIECDGAEDCAAGGRCCSHVIRDASDVPIGYQIACQAEPCGSPPVSEELCHPTTAPAGTCSTGTSCVTAYGNNNDLPRSLFVCR